MTQLAQRNSPYLGTLEQAISETATQVFVSNKLPEEAYPVDLKVLIFHEGTIEEVVVEGGGESVWWTIRRNSSPSAFPKGAQLIQARVALGFEGGAAPPINTPEGLTGDGGFLFRRQEPANLWTIAHPLGRFPQVTVQSEQGEEDFGIVEYIDANTLKIAWGEPTSGVAILK